MRVKYGNHKITYAGEVFDSKKEFARYNELKILEKAKKITNLRRQVKYELIPSQKDDRGKVIERAVIYVADFVYFDLEAYKEVVEDTKGFRTKDYILKRKMMLFLKGIRIKEI